MNKKLNVETRTKAGESSFSNGIAERLSKDLFEAFSKTLDVPHESEVTLAWTLSAKHWSLNNGGFTSYQLVYRHDVNNPSVLTDKLSALQPITSSETGKIWMS